MSVKIEEIQASISSLTDEELTARIRAIRGRRDAEVPVGTRTKTKTSAKEVKFAEALKNMSKEDLAELLAKLGG